MYRVSTSCTRRIRVRRTTRILRALALMFRGFVLPILQDSRYFRVHFAADTFRTSEHFGVLFCGYCKYRQHFVPWYRECIRSANNKILSTTCPVHSGSGVCRVNMQYSSTIRAPQQPPCPSFHAHLISTYGPTRGSCRNYLPYG